MYLLCGMFCKDMKKNSNIIIKQAGLKATPQRKIVYEIMTEQRHSPIEDITEEVRKREPEITLSTVYRILDSFCKVGLLSKFKHPNGKWYFDISPAEHYHIFMNDEVIDYIDPELTALVKEHLKGNMFENLEIEKISIQIITTKK